MGSQSRVDPVLRRLELLRRKVGSLELDRHGVSWEGDARSSWSGMMRLWDYLDF